jgi:hypothetical protein
VAAPARLNRCLVQVAAPEGFADTARSSGSRSRESVLVPSSAGGYTEGMGDGPPIPAELWNKISADAQVAVLELVRSLERRIATLGARLGQDSSNSSKPPSSDPIHVKRRPPCPPSGKKRGGQRGHTKHSRALVPPGRLALNQA